LKGLRTVVEDRKTVWSASESRTAETAVPPEPDGLPLLASQRLSWPGAYRELVRLL